MVMMLSKRLGLAAAGAAGAAHAKNSRRQRRNDARSAIGGVALEPGNGRRGENSIRSMRKSLDKSSVAQSLDRSLKGRLLFPWGELLIRLVRKGNRNRPVPGYHEAVRGVLSISAGTNPDICPYH
jgi:hypothetical protein